MSTPSSSAASSTPSNFNYNVVKEKTGHFSSRLSIQINDKTGKSATIYGKAMKDLQEGEINNILAQTEYQGINQSKNVDYVPIKIRRNEKDIIVFLSKENIYDTFSNKGNDNLLKPTMTDPKDINNFIIEHKATREDIVNELQRLSKKTLNKLTGSSNVLNRMSDSVSIRNENEVRRSEDFFNELEHNSIIYNILAAGISTDNANKIISFLEKGEYLYLTGEQRITRPIHDPDNTYPIHINKDLNHLPYSLLIDEDSVRILVKGKAEVKIQYKLRAFGTSKSVKTTYNPHTSQFEAQYTIEVGAAAREKAKKYFEKNGIPFDPYKPTKEQKEVMLSYEQNLIRLALEEYNLLKEMSGLNFTGFTTYKGSETRNSKQRNEEGKLHRLPGDTVVTFIAPLGKLPTDPSTRTQIVTGTNVNSVSPNLKQFLNETADILLELKKRNIAHRDIKPENLLIVDGHARIIDVGLFCEIDPVTGAAVDSTEETGMGTLTTLDTDQFLDHFPESLKIDKNGIKKEKLQRKNSDLRKCDMYSMAATWFMTIVNREVPMNRVLRDLLENSHKRYHSYYISVEDMLEKQYDDEKNKRFFRDILKDKIPQKLLEFMLTMLGPPENRPTPEAVKKFINEQL